MLLEPNSVLHKIQLMQNPQELKAYKITENFNWLEPFTNRTLQQIKTVDLKIIQNCVAQANLMEGVRKFLRIYLNKEAVIQVSSWWRPESVNGKIRGASSTSPHLRALATDFTVPGYTGEKGNQLVQACLTYYFDQVGFGLEITRGNWTHVDNRTIYGLQKLVFLNAGGGKYPGLNQAKILEFRKQHMPKLKAS